MKKINYNYNKMEFWGGVQKTKTLTLKIVYNSEGMMTESPRGPLRVRVVPQGPLQDYSIRLVRLG